MVAGGKAPPVETELEIIESPEGTKVGEKVVIRCRIKGLLMLDILRIVRKIDGEEHEIVSNTHVQDAFKNTGRYEVTENVNNFTIQERMIELTITSEYIDGDQVIISDTQ